MNTAWAKVAGWRDLARRLHENAIVELVGRIFPEEHITSQKTYVDTLIELDRLQQSAPWKVGEPMLVGVSVSDGWGWRHPAGTDIEHANPIEPAREACTRCHTKRAKRYYAPPVCTICMDERAAVGLWGYCRRCHASGRLATPTCCSPCAGRYATQETTSRAGG